MKKILLITGFLAVIFTSLPGQARVFVAERGVAVVAPPVVERVYVEPRPAPVVVLPVAPAAVYVEPRPVVVAPAAVYVAPRVVVGGPVARRAVVVR